MLQQERYSEFPAQNEAAFKETFNSLLAEYGSLSAFENVTCSVAQTNFTVVPASLFSVAEASKFLQFSVSVTITTSETDYARFNYFNCVGVFTIPSWIKSVLILKFPSAVITHERALLLRKLEQMSSGIKQMNIVLHDEHALFSYLEAGNLKWQLASVIENSDDALYHILNALERMEIQDATIQFYAHTSKAKEHLTAMTERKDKIRNLEKHKWQVANDSHLQFQLLCV